MINKTWYERFYFCAFAFAVLSLIVPARVRPVSADSNFFLPGNLLLARTVYDNNPNNLQVGVTLLPPVCSVPAGSCPSATAGYNGTYPQVFNNGLIDGSFGITSEIILDQVSSADGSLINSLVVPNSSQIGVPPTRDQMVTSFSSKSELALNLSTDGSIVTFLGYLAPVDTLDVSNSNTILEPDPSNPDGSNYHRVSANVDAHGKFRFTLTNAYSGDNGRAAIMNNSNGANLVYMSGNAGNGGTPQPNSILISAGAQILTPLIDAEVDQLPGSPTPVGSFNISQLGLKQDKIGKDDNFRGLTIFNNVLYFTKGSGGNSINTVYFVDTTGTVCKDFDAVNKIAYGVGLPAPGAALPTSPLAYSAAVLQTKGLDPNNMCILKGLPTQLAKTDTTNFPFGIWFADANTLYVADEGDGYAGGSDLYTHAGAQPYAGLEKWMFGTAANGLPLGQWNYVYTLQNGLGLGTSYTVTGYPVGLNLATCIVGINT